MNSCRCGACDIGMRDDQAQYLSGERLRVCPDCAKHARECEVCGRGYLTLAGLADGCEERDALIHRLPDGRWVCEDCNGIK